MAAHTTGTPETKVTTSAVRPGLMIRGLAWDVGLPLLVYYGLHQLGINDWTALLAGTGAAALRIVWGVLRDRTLSLFATVMLVVFSLGVMLGVVSGDARFLLLKSSIVTSTVGLAFLVTAWRGRPLTLAAAQSFNPGRSAELAEKYRTDSHVQRLYKLSSTVWGTGLLLEAVARVPLVYLLPISVMVGVSDVMMIMTFASLITWTLWYVRRAKAHWARLPESASLPEQH